MLPAFWGGVKVEHIGGDVQCSIIGKALSCNLSDPTRMDLRLTDPSPQALFENKKKAGDKDVKF